jgi:hypothetical protein
MRQPFTFACLLAAGLVALSGIAPPVFAEQSVKYSTADAEIVSTNVDDMTITVKIDGEEHTDQVSPLARTRLSEVKPGNKVVLSYKDSDGRREVVAIRAPKARPAK